MLSDLEAIFQKQREPEARDLYGSLEAYTKHSFLTLEGQSTLSTSSRFVAFGMKNIPELMWEPLMITIMHVLTQRFPTTLNSKGQRILSLTRLNMSAAMRQVVMSWKRRI